MSKSTTMASILPTPPSSPCISPRKSLDFQTEPPLHLEQDVQALSKRPTVPVVDATSNTIDGAKEHTTTIESPKYTISTLKEKLHIEDWKCGALTLKKTNCKRSIEDGKRDPIDALLESMTGLTQASPDFESALIKLVMLTLCYQHDAGLQKERRLEAWRLAFPPGSTDGRKSGIAIENLVRNALGPITTICIAQNNGKTCQEKIGGRKVQNQERTLRELVKQEVHSDDTKLDILLNVLSWNRTCIKHQNLRQMICIATWKKGVKDLNLPMPLDNLAVAGNVPNELTSPRLLQLDISLDPALVTTEKKDVVSVEVLPLQHALGSVFDLDADPALYWPKSYDSSPFDIIAHNAPNLNPIHSHQLIRTELRKLLDDRDLLSGQVYAYEVEGNEGYVKIGYTSRSVEERHQEWTFDCNRKTKPIYPSPSQEYATSPTVKEAMAALAIPILHARRVEALCHAELDQYRVRFYCSACLKQHIEWFEIPAAEATAVIQKWSRWMATQPYEVRQLRSKSIWTLKASEMRRMSNFERFLQEIGRASDLI